jgi:GNAT superfamily N-acetyltransferase
MKAVEFIIRKAQKNDTPTILRMIKELAEYEKMLHEVVATEELLEEWLFEKRIAEVLIGEYDGEPVGFALFYHSFSTFLGRAGIYLEDLYVRSEYRGRGFGKALLVRLAKIAMEKGCGRVEWPCFNWNTPSIEFYLSMGAISMNDRMVYRITDDKLIEMAKM